MHEIQPLTQAWRSRPACCLIALGFIAMIGLGTLVSRCTGRRTPALADDIAAKALELGHDPRAIESFVRDSVALEAYEGSLRGPVGTLWAMSGNAEDREALRRALLEVSRRRAWVPSEAPSAPVVNIALVADGNEASPVLSQDVRADACSGLALELATEAEGGAHQLAFTIGNTTWKTGIDPRRLRSLAVRFRFSSPRDPPVERTREIFTRDDADWPALDDPRNRYTFVVTTGWVSEWAASRRIVQASGGEEWRRRHAIAAWKFLSGADALTRRVAADFQVEAGVRAPRVIIVATEWGPSGQPAMSVDLRRDDVHVEGDPDRTAAFRSVRASLRAALESRCLAAAAGTDAFSAADLMADAWEGRQAGIAAQADLLERSFQRFLDSATLAGASLRVRPDGEAAPVVQVTRTPGGLRLAPPGEPPGEEIADVQEAVRRTMELLARPPWRPVTVGYREPTGRHWYEGARTFSWGGAELSLVFERQFTKLEPDLEFETVDYWDDMNDRFHDTVLRGSWTVPRDDLENARVTTLWLHANPEFHKGRMWDGISRVAYREAKQQGHTTFRVRNQSGEDSEPIRYWLTSTWKKTILLNNRSFEIPVILLEGDFASKNRPKPAPWKSPEIKDPKDGWVISRWVVLDDPDFPVLFRDGDQVQTIIPGTVRDSRTGRGIDGARVEIQGAGSAGVSWPDGGLSLPLIRVPYREFEVRATAPGYEPWSSRLDFRKADTFPLRIDMAALPRTDPFAWVTSAGAASVLPGLPLGARSRRLILQALAERPGLSVLVPRFPVLAPDGPVEAWIEVAETGECWPRMVDGLYGSTTADWLVSKATPKPWAAQHHAISYFSGRIAAWYLHAAGALDAVGAVTAGAEMSTAELHRHAARVARALAQVYDSAAVNFPGNPLVKGSAFERGLKDGLAWADRFYAEAWK